MLAVMCGDSVRTSLSQCMCRGYGSSTSRACYACGCFAFSACVSVLGGRDKGRDAPVNPQSCPIVSILTTQGARTRSPCHCRQYTSMYYIHRHIHYTLHTCPHAGKPSQPQETHAAAIAALPVDTMCACVCVCLRRSVQIDGSFNEAEFLQGIRGAFAAVLACWGTKDFKSLDGMASSMLLENMKV